jgi:autotransporter-associated beta strand protein
MKNTSALRTLSTCSLIATICSLITASHAAIIYWDGADTGGLNSAANWSTSSGATTPNPAAVPGALDDVIFNITTDNSNQTPTMNGAARSFRSITFSSTGTTTIVAGANDSTLTVGTGGITIASGAGAATLGDGSANSVLIALAGGEQTWTNNSASNFTINNTESTFSRATRSTIVFNQASTGLFSINTTSLPNDATGIIGNWALFGTGSNQRYAFNNGGTISAYTTGTVAADANDLTSATTNYDLTSADAILSANRTANTIRYAGTGGTIDLSTTAVTNNLTLNGILAVGASGTLTIQRTAGSGTLVTGSELVIAGPQDVTINAPISGAGGITKSGSSLLILGGTNTYTGATTLNSGTMNMSGTFGNTAITVNNGTLNIAGTVGTGAVTVNGGTLNMGGTGGNSTLTVNGGLLNYTSASAGAAAISISGGTLLLNGPRTGAIAMTGGTLLVGANATVSGQITMVGTIASDSTSARTITGRFVMNGNHTIGDSVNNGKLTFSNPLGTSTVGSSVRTVTVLSDAEFTTGLGGTGSGGLAKQGLATLTLGGTNTYAGVTNVNAGTLLVNGSISSSSLTTVASTATIGGSGTIGALTVSSGGFVNPGNSSPDTLDVIGAYTQAGTYNAGITANTVGNGTTGYDQISVTGTVNITGGSLAAAFSGGGYAVNNLIFILLNDDVDAITGTYTGLAQGATVINYGGFDWAISYTANSGTNSFLGGNDIALMAIPEPKAALLGCIGLLLILRRRR